ncbi:cyclase family protein [uncultured Lacinutrix sp.]|uniref:cyclase family protein n=1 Tax=uncultured Lacinutrix sp. TaxID=574032 RepID=UPI00261AE583|nr:cyclase family protein [uncultured Lacinutrix sp.]
MITIIQLNSKKIKIDLSKPLDISIPLRASKNNANAWYVDEPKIEPVALDDWIGSVKKGADVNFNNIYFNPHAHGTHTECVGHITEKFYSINKCLKRFVFTAEVITVAPEIEGDDKVISKKQIAYLLKRKTPEAIVIRTMPNTKDKKTKQYSNTNWPYLTEEAAIYLREKGIKHLLIDLPSVDKEKDDGKLQAHKAFWDLKGNIRTDATITEFIYVGNKIEDGSYILNIQIASFENDASPSKPVLYKIE